MSNYGLGGLKARNGIDKKALGRGIGSGCGKTSSYGHKGGKARSGRGKVSWFEGGQTPLYRRLPKRGFNSMQDKSGIACINVCDLQKACDRGVLDVSKDVNIDTLKSIGLIRQKSSVVRLLGTGKISVSVNIFVSYSSDSAVRSVEAVGGKVVIV